MITTYFNQADFIQAFKEIKANGEEPMLYVSQENAANLISMLIPMTVKQSKSSTIIEDEYDVGFVGKYRGALVYVTKEVGDLYVIVPRYKEEIKK